MMEIILGAIGLFIFYGIPLLLVFGFAYVMLILLVALFIKGVKALL